MVEELSRPVLDFLPPGQLLPGMHSVPIGAQKG